MKSFRIGSACVAAALALNAVDASAVTLVLTKLGGLTGSAPNAETAVYSADLNSLPGTFKTIKISDNSGGTGGSPGQFSGFDLDGIKLSYDSCATAACAATASFLPVFNFTSGYLFSPGTQRPTASPSLFGATGATVNNATATLGAFDAVSNTSIPSGFLSLGDEGEITFNLTNTLSGKNLFLYIGEVGDNGEVAASTIEVGGPVGDPPGGVPEPATWAMMLAGFGLVGGAMRRRQRASIQFA